MNAVAAKNPGLLKLMLGLEGVAVERSRKGAVDLIVQDDLWVRARINPDAALRLVERDGSTFIQTEDTCAEAQIVPEARFSTRRTRTGVMLGEIARVRGAYATIALRGGCGLSAVGRLCSVCLGRELTEKAGEMWEIEDVLTAVDAAFGEGTAEAVHLQAGFFPGDDAGLQRILPYVEAIRHHFDTMVVLTMHPPASQRVIDLTYASGVDAISYNLEAADETSMQKYFPGRARFFGRARYLDALRHAARVFPNGAVWSELALGVSAPDAIGAAIDALCGIGVVPILGLPQAPVGETTRPADLAPVCARLFDSVLKAGVNMTWARDLPTVITPLEARHFVANAPQLSLLHQLARNRIGAIATRSLSRLRRRLRVKRVRASLDSSRL